MTNEVKNQGNAMGHSSKSNEKAVDRRDHYVPPLLRFIGRELRGTPHWARLMRKLNLPEG